jgi:hypothetical protein
VLCYKVVWDTIWGIHNHNTRAGARTSEDVFERACARTVAALTRAHTQGMELKIGGQRCFMLINAAACFL